MQDSNKEPKKPKRKARAKPVSKAKAVKPQIPEDKPSILNGTGIGGLINKELEKSIEQFIDDATTNENIQERDVRVLESVVSEWLKTFIIVGFNMDGTPVTIGVARTEQDYLSLIEHFRHTFFKMMMNREVGGPKQGM